MSRAKYVPNARVCNERARKLPQSRVMRPGGRWELLERLQTHSEILALDVLGRADGHPVTSAMVEARLAALRRHRPDCWCGVCRLVGGVSAGRVWTVVNTWQRPRRRRRCAGCGEDFFGGASGCAVLFDAV
jgi:hypothetical protein